MQSRTEANRSCRHMAARALILVLAAAPTAGCDVRDEAARPAAAPRPWPLAALDSATRLGDGRANADGPLAIEYLEGFEAASRRAASGSLPILLVFRASWCRWSSEVAQGPLADRSLVGLSRRFACATVDADRDPDICRSFSVTAFPTVILLDAHGRERFRATGASAAGGLAAAMTDVLSNPIRPQRLAADPEPRAHPAPDASAPVPRPAAAPAASQREPDTVR